MSGSVGTTFELWDAAAGTAIGEYPTEAAALADVAQAIRRNGRQSVSTFGLLRVTARGRGRLLAEGEALADRALSATRETAGTPRTKPAPVGA